MILAQLHLYHVNTELYASSMDSFLRMLFLFLVAVAITAVVVPPKRISMLDFQLWIDYFADIRDVLEDPDALPPPRVWTILWILADYAIGALFFFIDTASGGHDVKSSTCHSRPS